MQICIFEMRLEVQKRSFFFHLTEAPHNLRLFMSRKKNQIRLRLQKGVTNIATHIMLPRTCKAQVSKIERLHMSALSDRKNINWI